MKDYQKWHNLKSEINDKQNQDIVYFREKQIWWCSLGANIGYEQDGKNNNFERPVLILRKFSADVVWVLPLTSNDKKGKYYYQYKYNENNYSIILSQIRLISSKRLLRKIRIMPDGDMEKIKKKLVKLL